MIAGNKDLDVVPAIPWYTNLFVLDDSNAETNYVLLKDHDSVFPPEEEDEKRRRANEAANLAKKENDLTILFDALKMTKEQIDQAFEEQWLGSVLIFNEGGRIGALIYNTDEASTAIQHPIKMKLGTILRYQKRLVSQETL
ncbi:MAG: hypothetical protein Q9M91_03580 [Candidatus Dojkabacteria bacterium]|nr:hypothetical protein [Candidatus Dojkabacteria bacterium]MDQ7020901.1 hypothetical protein [Candidatus Dojkabacteria bacterium]